MSSEPVIHCILVSWGTSRSFAPFRLVHVGLCAGPWRTPCQWLVYLLQPVQQVHQGLTHTAWLVPCILRCSWGLQPGQGHEPGAKPVSDLRCVPLHQPFIFMQVCKRIGKEPWDWRRAYITLKRMKEKAPAPCCQGCPRWHILWGIRSKLNVRSVRWNSAGETTKTQVQARNNLAIALQKSIWQFGWITQNMNGCVMWLQKRELATVGCIHISVV